MGVGDVVPWRWARRTLRGRRRRGRCDLLREPDIAGPGFVDLPEVMLVGESGLRLAVRFTVELRFLSAPGRKCESLSGRDPARTGTAGRPTSARSPNMRPYAARPRDRP